MGKGGFRMGLGKTVLAVAGLTGIGTIGSHYADKRVGNWGCAGRAASAMGYTNAVEDAALYVDKHVGRRELAAGYCLAGGLAALGAYLYRSGRAARDR